MADFKYNTETETILVWDAEYETFEKAEAAGKACAAFNPRELPGSIQRMILVNGCKTIMQQRTSSLRGKASLREILQAMEEVFSRWLAGEWEAQRTSAEARKPLLVARLARALSLSGNRAGEPALFAALILKKVDELEAMAKHHRVAPYWEQACREVVSVAKGEDELFGLD